jgi:hypothetical protein
MTVIGAYGTGAKPIIRGDLFARTWTAIPGRPGYYQAFVGNGSLVLWMYAYRNGVWSKMGSSVGGQPHHPTEHRETWLDSLTENTWGPGGNADTIYLHTYGSAALNVDSLRPVRQANFVGGTFGIIRDLELRYFHHGLYTTNAASATSLSNSIIRNLTVTSTIAMAVYLVNAASSDNIVDSCRVDSTGWTPLYVYLGSRNKWRYNYVSHVLPDVRGMHIGGQELCGAGDQGSAGGGYTGSGNVWEYNTFEDVTQNGIDSYWNNADTIRNNTFRRMQGIIFPFGKNIVISGNTGEDISNKGFNIDNIGAGVTLVKDNTISGTGWGMSVVTNTEAPTISEGSGTVIITNNTFTLTGTTSIFADYLAPGVTATKNNYIGPGRWRAGTSNTVNTLYFTLPSFQSATGYEAGSTWSSGSSAPTGAITVTPDSLPANGGTITLQWTSTNATSASISYRIDNVDTVINVNTIGSRAVNVSVTTTFVLTLIGPFGTTSLSTHVIVGTTPADYSLEQNYPNPFNTTTTIGFVLPKDDYVSLKVFDINGREITTLVEGMQTRGTHQILWNPKRVASGVYRYRLIAGLYSKTRRLVIVR